MGAREQSGASTASRPRTPAKGASVCGSDPTPALTGRSGGSCCWTIRGLQASRAASAAFSSGARRMGARSNQVHRRLRARALRQKAPAFAALTLHPRSPAGAVAALLLAEAELLEKPRIAGAGAQAEPQAQRFPAERVGWVPGSNQVHRRLRARALRQKAPAFAALTLHPALTGRSGGSCCWKTGRGLQAQAPKQSRKRSAFQRSASDGCPGAIRCLGGFAPAHSGKRRLRLRLWQAPAFAATLHPALTGRSGGSCCWTISGLQAQAPKQSRKRSVFQRSASDGCPGAIRCIGGFAPAHSGTKRLRLRLCSPYTRAHRPERWPLQRQSWKTADCRRRRFSSRAASAALSSGARRMGAREQSGVSAASRPRTPAKDACVCGSGNQVYRRLRARALRQKAASGRHHQTRKRSG
jgi:hypothetical protein